MSKRWNVSTPIEYDTQGQSKTKWVRLGAAFENRDGSISIQLDALPTNGRLMLFEPRDDERRGNDRRDDQRGRR